MKNEITITLKGKSALDYIQSKREDNYLIEENKSLKKELDHLRRLFGNKVNNDARQYVDHRETVDAQF